MALYQLNACKCTLTSRTRSVESLLVGDIVIGGDVSVKYWEFVGSLCFEITVTPRVTGACSKCWRKLWHSYVSGPMLLLETSEVILS